MLPLASGKPVSNKKPGKFETTYTVKKGDTLSGIALKHNDTVKYIQYLNDTEDLW
ncbi:LysM domain-containing protein [Bacillus swezeyi]